MILLSCLLIVFLTFLGWLIIKGFELLTTSHELEKIPYAFALGIGIVGFQMYFYSRLAIEWSRVSLLIPLVCVMVGLIFFKYKKIFHFNNVHDTFTKKDYIVMSGIAILLLFVGFESIVRPLSAWDGWAIWLIKSKMFFIDGSINPAGLIDLKSGYPILLSLIGTYFYVIYGVIDDTAILLLFYTFYFALGILFYSILKKHTSTTFSLLFTFLLLATQNLIRHGGRYEAGQADLSIGFYVLLCAYLLYRYVQSFSFKELILLQIFLSIISLIKNEGLAFACVVQLPVLFLTIKHKKYWHVLASAVWLLPVIDWQLYKNIVNLTKLYHFENSHLQLERLPIIFIEIVRELVNIQNWNLLWVLTVMTVSFYVRDAIHKFGLFFYLLLVQLGIYITIYIITPVDIIIQIRSSLDRLLIHIAPLALFISSLIIFEQSKKQKRIHAFFKAKK